MAARCSWTTSGPVATSCPAGHGDPGEHPADAARREAREELGIEADFEDPLARPALLTVTVTGGSDAGHTDVSLWFVLAGRRDMPLVADPLELRSISWWTPPQIRRSGPEGFDPHYGRFLAKLGL